MPKTYIAYNPVTDEMIASPCFKTVYNAAMINLRYTGYGLFKIYATTLDFENYTYKQAVKQMTLENRHCKITANKNSSFICISNYPNGEFNRLMFMPKREPND